ncbi:MAG TPA: penicillin-binding protein 2 [Solirubrobacterales bacterium]|jgi:cell division protein FtsI/penicillin-binding protein 2|nr:penicillin-binding protein 2 [Solirubrobacterales bacterium]
MRTIERRIGLLFAGFLLCFLVIGARAFWLQGVQGAKLASEASYQQTEVVTVPGLRGSVLDRYGNPLAVSEDAKTIYATPYQVEHPGRDAAKLAEILDLDREDVLESLTADSGFSYVARKVPLPAAARVARLELEGIGELPDSRRTYPQGDLAAQTIGAVGADNEGLTGLEAGKESVLRGEDGERRIVKDALGEPIRLETVSETEDGEDLRLTLDPAIEEKTEEVLAGVGETYSPKGATAIVMDPRNSQILAMANWPPVDPSDLESASPEDLMNRATGFTYEPGSTFKAFTVSAALQEKLVSPETTFTLQPQLHVADRIIEDAEPRPTVTLSVAEILSHSSNVGAATIGLLVGGEKFSRWIERFGFGRPTGVQFPAEEQGIVPALDEYSGSTMGNLPIGQGLAVTPMQMVAGYAAIANGGVLRQPQLIERIGDEAVSEPKGHRVIEASVAEQVRTMLEGVLAPGGTASEVSVPGYTLAGKTGTAQVAENGTYSETKYVASFIGFAPAQDPRLLVAVIVDQPQGEIYGGAVAAPAFGRIAEFALPYLGVAPE